MKIAIIGSGVYGISMAIMLAENKNNEIHIWCESIDTLNEIERQRNSFPSLGNVAIPSHIKFSTSYEDVLDGSSLVFIMVASKFVSIVAKDMKPFMKDEMTIVVGTKGLNNNLLYAFEEVQKEIKNDVAVISGGTFAIELAKKAFVGLTVATQKELTYNKIQQAYFNTSVTLEYCSDLYSTSLGGAIKNVIALGCGILDGLGYGDSTRSLYLTLAINELAKLVSCSSSVLTFALFGDLIMTATSKNSRNYSYGFLIGQKKYEEASNYLNENTVEGYDSLKNYYNYFAKQGKESNLINILYDYVINKNYSINRFNEIFKTK